jgi:hypothetical protein
MTISFVRKSGSLKCRFAAFVLLAILIVITAETFLSQPQPRPLLSHSCHRQGSQGDSPTPTGICASWREPAGLG